MRLLLLCGELVDDVAELFDFLAVPRPIALALQLKRALVVLAGFSGERLDLLHLGGSLRAGGSPGESCEGPAPGLRRGAAPARLRKIPSFPGKPAIIPSLSRSGPGDAARRPRLSGPARAAAATRAMSRPGRRCTRPGAALHISITQYGAWAGDVKRAAANRFEPRFSHDAKSLRGVPATDCRMRR